MGSPRKLSPWITVLVVLVVLPLTSLLSQSIPGKEGIPGEEKPTPAESEGQKPSQYAPASDLAAQVEDFMKSLDDDLGDPKKYGLYEQRRVAKDANTVAALALVLGKHDEQNKWKGSAAAVIKAARHLGDNSADYEKAKAGLEALKQAVATSKTATDVELQWEPVADIVQLMQQVPVVNNSLRGVTGRRFKRSQDKNAGYAATLAAIAQASMYDTDYCGDEDSERQWKQICVEMRDAAAAVNQAVRKGDQEAATQGLTRLVKTCDACHEQFR